MTFVAFFRNLNLGHETSPDRAQLESAFTDAGALNVRSFQTNGTVLFTADDPATVIAATLNQLRDRCGYNDCVLVRSTTDLRGQLAKLPPPATSPGVYRETISFFDNAPSAGRSPPNQDQLVALISVHDDHAHATITKVGNRVGNVTRHLEAVLEVPVTTRTRGTVERLLLAAEQ